MPKSYSSLARHGIHQLDGELPLVLIEITHSGLPEPVRVVGDTADITSNGHLYIAAPFRIVMPDDQEGQVPKARLAIDNVGSAIMDWVETSSGASGAQVRMMQVMRGTPDEIEFEITMDLTNIEATPLEVSGQLGFDDVLNTPAVQVKYRPDNTPGLF